MVFKGIRYEADESLFQRQVAQIEAFEDTLEDEALEAAIDLEGRLSEIYATAPPRDDSKFIWSTDAVANRKAQSWWFANLADGNIPTDGNHYLRQGKPPYGAMVRVEREANNRIVILVVQTNDRMKYVFGTLSATGRADTRNVTHVRTGWNFAKPDVDKASNEILVSLLDDVIARLGRF